jgi:hypothetical protein
MFICVAALYKRTEDLITSQGMPDILSVFAKASIKCRQFIACVLMATFKIRDECDF